MRSHVQCANEYKGNLKETVTRRMSVEQFGLQPRLSFEVRAWPKVEKTNVSEYARNAGLC